MLIWNQRRQRFSSFSSEALARAECAQCSPWILGDSLLSPLPPDLFSTHPSEVSFLGVISQRPSPRPFPAFLLLDPSEPPTAADPFFWKLAPLTTVRTPPISLLVSLPPPTQIVNVFEGSVLGHLNQAFTFNYHLSADDFPNI